MHCMCHINSHVRQLAGAHARLLACMHAPLLFGMQAPASVSGIAECASSLRSVSFSFCSAELTALRPASLDSYCFTLCVQFRSTIVTG